jgi:hypothetical protein
MMSFKCQAWRPALLRQFCAAKPKHAASRKADANHYFNLIYERKYSLEEELQNGFPLLRPLLADMTKPEYLPHYVPALRAAEVFRVLVEKNLLKNSGSELFVTYLLNNIDPENKEGMQAFFKAYDVDHESWSASNLLTKLDVLLVLLEHSPSEVYAEFVASLDETIAQIAREHHKELDASTAVEVAAMILHVNAILKENFKPQLTKSVESIKQLQVQFEGLLDKAKKGESLQAVVEVLDFMHFKENNLSNTTKLLQTIEAKVKSTGGNLEEIPKTHWTKVESDYL